jgi:hypothetical protein
LKWRPGITKLSAVVASEIEFQRRLWQGHYEQAVESAGQVIAGLTAPELQGYRALCCYLAGSAVKPYPLAIGGSISMLMNLMTGAAFVAAVLAGATPAEAQSFQNVVETFYGDEFRAHPIAATDIGVAATGLLPGGWMPVENEHPIAPLVPITPLGWWRSCAKSLLLPLWP